MAIQRVDPSVTIQPTQTTSDPLAGAQQAVAGRRASAFASVEQAADQIGQIATNYLRDTALKQAQDDAAGIVEYDKDGNLLVPQNFDAPIGGGLIYSQTYARAAEANYKHAAINEFQGQAGKLQAQFPTDPEAFSAKLIEYRDAKIAAMPPAVRPLMLAHFETIRSQGATSIGAARQRVVNETTMRNANELQEKWVNDYAAFKQSEATGNFGQPEYENHKLKLDDRWNDYVAMARQSGMPQVWIDRQRQLAETQADARNFFSKIGDQIGGSGESAATVLGNAQKDIEAFERKYPGQEAQAIIAAERQRAFARGQAQASGAVTASNVQTDTYRAELAGLDAEMRERRREITSNPADYPNQSEALRALNIEIEDRRTALNARVQQSSALRPLQKASLSLGILDQRDAATQRSVSMAAATSMNAAMDLSAPASSRAAAMADLEGSLRSPEMVSFSLSSPQGAALYRNIQQTVNEARMQSASVAIGTYREAWANGRIAPEREGEMLQMGIQKGWVGSVAPGQVRPEEMVQLAGRNRELFRKNQQVNTAATTAINNVAAGGVPSEKDRELIGTAVPFKVQAYDYSVGKSVDLAPDFNNPGHVSAALAYINKTLTVPEGLRQYLEAGPGVASPEQRAHMLSVGQSIQRVFDNHFKSSPNGPVPIDERNQLVAAQMRAQLGKGADFIAAVSKLGPDATPASLNQAMAGDTRRRENPDKPDDTAKGILDELQGVVSMGSANIFDKAYYGAVGMLDPEGLTGMMFGPDKVRRWGMMSDAATFQIMQGVAKSSALSVEYISGKTVEIDGTLAQHIVGHGERYKNQYGRTDEENRLNPNRQAILDYFNRNGSDLALREVKKADGGVEKYVLERKPFFLEANKAAGVSMDQSQWENMMSLTARLKRPDLFTDAGQGSVDPSTVRVQSAERPDGTKVYGLYGYNWKASSTVYIGDVDPKDDTIGFARARIYQAVAEEMKDSRVASLLSNMPLFGDLIDQKLAGNFKESILKQSSGRDMPSDATASLFATMRTALTAGPFTEFIKPEYDEAWKKVETMTAKRGLNRYGGLGYLLGYTSPERFIMPTTAPDNRPDVGGTFNDEIIDPSQAQKQSAAEGRDAVARRYERSARDASTSRPPPEMPDVQLPTVSGVRDRFQDAMSRPSDDLATKAAKALRRKPE